MLITEKIILVIEGREEHVSEFRVQLYRLIVEHKSLKITIKEREKVVK